MDIIALGELLVDFTPAGLSSAGHPLYEQNPGGAPANVLVAAARQGASTAMISAVGRDALGKALIRTLQSEGINTGGIQTTARACTTLAIVTLDADGERSFDFYRKPGADMLIDKDKLPVDYFPQCKIFHFGSLSLSAPASMAATLAAIEAARRAGAAISFDPNWRAGIWPSVEDGLATIRAFLPHAHYLKLSEEELPLITQTDDIEAAVRGLFKASSLRLVVVTLGSRGCRYFIPAHSGAVPGHPATVVDTTGAGDAFWGVLLSALATAPHIIQPQHNALLQHALRCANVAGALCTQAKGAMDPIPTRQRIEAEIAKFEL